MHIRAFLPLHIAHRSPEEFLVLNWPVTLGQDEQRARMRRVAGTGEITKKYNAIMRKDPPSPQLV